MSTGPYAPWIPEELAPAVIPANSSVVHATTLVIPADTLVIPAKAGIQPAESDPEVLPTPLPSAASIEWLHGQIENCVELPLSIAEILNRGRDFEPRRVLQLRLVNYGARLHPDLVWPGPTTSVGEQIRRMAETHARLLSADAAETATLRFRIRLQAMELENLLLAYFATELIDPKVLNTTLTMDLLVHSSQLVPEMLVVSLGLARAALDEQSPDAIAPAYTHDQHWPLIEAAWTRATTDAVDSTSQWARQTIVAARKRAAYHRP